jgi:hypothetical protein
LFGTPTLAINDADVAPDETLHLDKNFPQTALASNYDSAPGPDEYYSFTYAIVYPPGKSAVPSLGKSGGFLLKTGFVAKTPVLSVIMDEDNVVVPSPRDPPVGWAKNAGLGAYTGIAGLRVMGSKTMILAYAMSTEGSTSAQSVTTAEVLVVSDCSATGCSTNGVAAIPLGTVTGQAKPTMAPLSTGIAVALSSADGSGFKVYFVGETGISSVITPALPAGSMQSMYAPIAAVQGSSTEVAIAQHGRMVVCTSSGCDEPGKNIGYGTVKDLVCLSKRSCIASTTSALVLLPMANSTAPSVLAEVAGKDLGSAKAAALSESHLFFHTPSQHPSSSSFWSPVAETDVGFAVWEKASTWTGRFLQPAYEAGCPSLTGEEICGGRTACEMVCDRIGDCVGFTIDEDDTCRIYDTCAATVHSSLQDTVLKEKEVLCNVTVEGAVFPEGVDKSHLDNEALPSLLNTIYSQTSPNVFLSSTNETAIFYDAAQVCLGYVLGMNPNPSHTIFAITYPDADGQVHG